MTEKKFDLPITRYPDGKAFIGNTIDGKPDGTGWMFEEPKYYGDWYRFWLSNCGSCTITS